MLASLFSLVSTLLLVNAAPTNSPTELIAFAPTIITPDANSIWIAGAKEQVTWRTDNVPNAARNYTLKVLLGYLENNSENLDTDNPLAVDIPILDGSTTVLVPSDTTPRNNSIVVLIGDSGDASSQFTII